MRLDQYLVEKHLFSSKSKAQLAIIDGNISINGLIVTKKSFDVKPEMDVKIVGNLLPYVSRGGSKLEKAIKEFNISLRGKKIIDIGSSTGGFTDCAIQNNAANIIAVDVGKNQFDLRLLESNRVALYESTDFRDLDLEIYKEVDLAVIDVSFISILKLLPKLIESIKLNEIVLLIKPQFECGKEVADHYKGIVLDKIIHKNVIKRIIYKFSENGFFLQDITFSPIRGGSGNIEYLAYFNKQRNLECINSDEIIESAFSYFDIQNRNR